MKKYIITQAMFGQLMSIMSFYKEQAMIDGLSELKPIEPLTDEQIVQIRKESFGGRFGNNAFGKWYDTLKFARAIEAHITGGNQ